MSRLNLVSLLSLTLLFSTKVVLEKRKPVLSFQQNSLQLSQVVSKTKTLEDFSFGFRSFLASLLWIELLQTASHQRLENDGVSQEFSSLHTLVHLDSRFEPSYVFGNSYLSILRFDRIGAYHILKKWKETFPLSWRAHFYYGFHCYHEMGNVQEGASAILRAASLPRSPPWLNALGVGLLNETGQLEVALLKSIELYEQISDAETRERLELRVEAILQKFEVDRVTAAIIAYHAEKKKWPEHLEEVSSYLAPRRGLSSLEGMEIPDALVPILKKRVELIYDKKTQLVSPKDNKLNHLGITKS